MRRARGMTLVELMVAMAIFSMLGMTLTVMLRQGIETWRTGEARRAVYEDAQALIGALRDDLRATFAVSPATPGVAPRVRFICDADPLGRQRVALVRTLPAESRHPIAALAGTMVGGDADLDGRGARAGVASRP